MWRGLVRGYIVLGYKLCRQWFVVFVSAAQWHNKDRDILSFSEPTFARWPQIRSDRLLHLAQEAVSFARQCLQA